ncbi:hypothetical protein NQ317_016629 [Molorchus minor]|uniref:Uncharacterized protein n=1 Tax=Molorchus minor TaxID=1323400 RepID=A0ABQ9IZ33_9CUCU|nr:hypothetical protein NQ317_016629 [Molorchus minor]
MVFLGFRRWKDIVFVIVLGIFGKNTGYAPTMDSVACVSCVGLLNCYINFATRCASTEEK